MIEELKDTSLADKVGGRFKLAALIQKRMLELMQGGRPLIENIDDRTTMQIAIEEIRQGKIAIDYEVGRVTKPENAI